MPRALSLTATLGLAIAIVLGLIDATRASSAVALTGYVSSAAEGPHGRRARQRAGAPGSTITATVVSDAHGRYRVPGLGASRPVATRCGSAPPATISPGRARRSSARQTMHRRPAADQDARPRGAALRCGVADRACPGRTTRSATSTTATRAIASGGSSARSSPPTSSRRSFCRGWRAAITRTTRHRSTRRRSRVPSSSPTRSSSR